MVKYEFRTVPRSNTTSRNAVHVSVGGKDKVAGSPPGKGFVSMSLSRNYVIVYISFPASNRLYWIGRRDPSMKSAALTDYDKVKMSARRVGLLARDSPDAFHFAAR